MRIGIFGGSFNPVHSGHLAVAEAAMRSLALDRVLFVPAAVPPHKRGEKLASDADRLEMLRLALRGREGFVLDEREIRRKGVSYTIDTVEELRRERPAGTEWFLILGSDSLPLLPKWRETQKLLGLVTPVVYPRRDFPREKLDSLAGALPPQEVERLRRGFLDLPTLEVSATEIRKKRRLGEGLEGLVPPAVAEYLRSHDPWR